MDRIIVLDYLIANVDRHQNNFGILRRADTLKWLGAAPIYDSGSCLWFDQLTENIPISEPSSKPFKSTHETLIRLVSSFDWLDLSRLDGVEEEAAEILKDAPHIGGARREALCKALMHRIRKPGELVRRPALLYASVTEDIAYSGME